MNERFCRLNSALVICSPFLDGLLNPTRKISTEPAVDVVQVILHVSHVNCLIVSLLFAQKATLGRKRNKNGWAK